MKALVIYSSPVAGWQFTVRETDVIEGQAVLGEQEFAHGEGFASEFDARAAGQLELAALREESTT